MVSRAPSALTTPSLHMQTHTYAPPCMYRHIEGPYWLVQIFGKAYQAEEDLLISGQEIPKGYWLVDAQWYKLVSHLTCSC